MLPWFGRLRLLCHKSQTQQIHGCAPARVPATLRSGSCRASLDRRDLVRVTSYCCRCENSCADCVLGRGRSLALPFLWQSAAHSHTLTQCAPWHTGIVVAWCTGEGLPAAAAAASCPNELASAPPSLRIEQARYLARAEASPAAASPACPRAAAGASSGRRGAAEAKTSTTAAAASGSKGALRMVRTAKWITRARQQGRLPASKPDLTDSKAECPHQQRIAAPVVLEEASDSVGRPPPLGLPAWLLPAQPPCSVARLSADAKDTGLH